MGKWESDNRSYSYLFSKEMIKASQRANYFFVMLDTCDCSVLRHLLHPAADYIWIHRHWPDATLRWRTDDVPISPNDVLGGVEVRAMEFDLMLRRRRFLDELDRFLPHGMHLTQLSKPVPDSLWLPSLPEDQRERILIDNGMTTQFELPHAGGIAQFSSTDRDHIESVCALPEIRELVLK